jgi:hypothetical protein
MTKIASETRGIIGMPPLTYVSDNLMANSMPIAEIVPCKPNFSRGMTLFSVTPDTITYDSILSKHGFTIEHPIKLAFLADNFPTDSFSNEYGETFLEKFTGVASSGIQDALQMTGSRTVTEALAKGGSALEQTGKNLGGTSGSVLGAVGGFFAGAEKGMKEFKAAMKEGGSVHKMIGGGADTINNMLAGHRVDFPQVWRNSSFSPSYSMTVRLYNPAPGSETATKKYIIGPLAAILCLGIPRTKEGQTYNWPFFHKFKSKGIYNLDPAVISNITVVKGGDNQQIAFTQRLGIVDVRIDFTSLFGSMVLEEDGPKNLKRPTVSGYLKALETQKTMYDQYKSQYVLANDSVNMTDEDLLKRAMKTQGKPITKLANVDTSRVATKNATTTSTILARAEPGTYDNVYV